MVSEVVEVAVVVAEEVAVEVAVEEALLPRTKEASKHSKERKPLLTIPTKSSRS